MTAYFLHELPHVVCRCGRIFFEGQEPAMWRCVREHLAAKRAAQEFQEMVNRMTKEPIR